MHKKYKLKTINIEKDQLKIQVNGEICHITGSEDWYC